MLTKCRISLEVTINKIPEPGPEFTEWCEENNIAPFGDGSVGRRAWCDWLGEYVRDYDYLVNIIEGSTRASFFAYKEDIHPIKE